jgi:hypothetical protein
MTPSSRGIVWKLGGMPDGNDPYGPSLDTVEELVGPHDDLSIRQIGKLGDGAPGPRELLEAAQDLLGPLAESCSG